MRKLQNDLVASAARARLYSGLVLRPGTAGFFGEVFITLNGLRLAEKLGVAARVEWGAGVPYFEAERGPNAWDYFFEQSAFEFAQARPRLPLWLPYRPGAEDFDPYSGLSVRASAGRALHAWCRPRPEISDEVTAFAAAHFKAGKTLGVHVRFTDAAAGRENRKTVDIDTYFAEANRWLDNAADGVIFLAADDQRVVEAFAARYPGRTVHQECLRSTDGTSIHGHYDAGVAGSPYRKGYEVLVDALLLARCDHIVRTHSRVTCFTLCWNLALTYTDLEKTILGIDRTPWLHV